MARLRSELQFILEDIMTSVSPTLTKHVFFQAPAILPDTCIKYERDSSYVSYADNTKYAKYKRYQVTVLARNPDSPIPDLVENLPHTRFDRFFVANGINHWTYNLYF